MSHLDLPNIYEVRQDKWDQHAFNEESALRVVDNGEGGYDFYVNLDNIHLLTEQKANSSISPQLLGARYEFGLVLVGVALLGAHNGGIGQSSAEEEDVFSRISSVSKVLSPVLLPMIASLGELQLDEPAEILEEE